MKKWFPLLILSFALIGFVAYNQANKIVTNYLAELDATIENISKKHNNLVSDLENNVQVLEKQIKDITTLDTKISELSKTIWKPVISVRAVPINKDTPPEILRMMPGTGGGTGFFFKQEGDEYYIVTNLHVIQGYLNDQKNKKPKLKLSVITGVVPWEYEAEYVGSDPITDLAILKIKTKEDEKFNVVEFVGKGEVTVGTQVVTVGHGLNLFWTITTGIVTGVNRIEAMPLNFMLQHDAVINMGNSGGPVFNLDGKVIGVNTLILSPRSRTMNAGWDGIAFAVNAWQALRSAEAILKDGKVTYPNYDFKVRLATLEEIKAIGDNFEERTYAILNGIEEDTEAYKAGLRNGDIVYAVDEYEVYSPVSLMSAVMAYHIGDIVTIKVKRGDELLEFEYELLELKL